LTIPATPAAAGQAITTGSGADKVTLAGSIGSTTATAGGLVTTTIALGAGNDAVAKGTSGAVTAGASINGGDGVDTVDASLITIGNQAIFTNFERLDLRGATDSGSFDASVMTASTIDGIKLNGSLATAFAVTNLAGTTITADIAATTAAAVTATLATSTGTADVMNINFASSNTLTSSSTTPAITEKVTVSASGGLKTTGIETVNISSGGTYTNTVNFANQNQILNELKMYTDNSNATSSIVITGAKEFTLGELAITRNTTTTVITAAPTQTADGITQNATLSASSTAPALADQTAGLKSIDASATTGGVNIWAGVSDQLGSTSFYQKYTGLTITGGSGSDFIRNSATSGVISGGAGDDWLVVSGTSGSADGGAGNDTLIAGYGTNATLTGGAGKDTFDVTAAVQNSANDSAVVITDTLKTITITDFAAGDTLKVGETSLTSAVMVNGTAAVTASNAQSLFAAIDAALKATTSTTGITANVGTDVSVWFSYGGNTYIAVEKGSTDGYSNGDVVVKLTGIHTLTAAAAPTVATGLFGEA